jgi:hypothetical protein
VSKLSPEQRRTRERVERLIRLASPALDLVLAMGDRVSRFVEPEDVEYYPPRVAREEPAPSAETPPER